jgi:hypothetical protein
MKFMRSIGLAAVGLAAAVSLSSPAAADVWWETENGTLYWDGTVDDYGVFRYMLRDQNNAMDKNSAFFIDGLGPLYTSGGSMTGKYEGLWFKYGGRRKTCDFEVEDPNGVTTNSWGSLSIEFKADENYFTLKLADCEHSEISNTLNGTPGL